QEALAKANQALEHPMEILTSGDWNENSAYIQALADQVLQALAGYADRKVPVIFSAHSLPVAHIANGDTYEQQLQGTLQAILRKTGPLEHYLAYQSKGGGQGDWLGPEVEEILDMLASHGKTQVLLVPFGFTCDHIETLYDIDTAIAGHARNLGIALTRTMALNCDPGFIRALAGVAAEVMEREVVG
ncbi:MAG TPA: ferrochelatase, partial [Bacillota bacterium]|nr:ferrochelatase [Bacillota bacterium]